MQQSPRPLRATGPLGDPATLAVERAVAELRAGRPVAIDAEPGACLALPFETALGDRRAWDLSCIVLSGAHPVSRGETALMDVGGLTDEEIEDLVLEPVPPGACPPAWPASAAAQAAVALAKAAQLLPVAFVGPDPAHPLVARVAAAAVTEYHGRVAQGLRLVARTPVPLADDHDAEFVVFRGSDGLKDQIAIVVGAPDLSGPVPVRLHSACLTGDLFHSLKCDCGEQLRRGLRRLAEAGGGVICYLDQEGRGIGLSNKMRTYKLQSEGLNTVDSDRHLGFGADERQYTIAAKMLTLLGIGRVSLLTNNPEKIAAIKAEGIEVTGRVALLGAVNPHNRRYLEVKAAEAGHLLPTVGKAV